MSNPYYGHGDGVPVYLARGNSSTMQAEFDLVATGFDGAYTAILARGLIAGQAWTGAQNFTGATVTVPTLTYGATGNGAVSVDLLNSAVFSAANLPAQSGKAGYALFTDGSIPYWALTTSVIKVSERQANTVAGSAVTTGSIAFTRVLNTVDINTVTGASLASNTVTLPAGTYDVFIRAPVFQLQFGQAFLYNSSDSTYTLLGSNRAGASATATHDCIVTGRFTIATAKNFTVRNYVSGGTAPNAVSSGQGEVYTEATFLKVA